MNKSESKYFNTARKMDEAFLEILEKKDLEYITVKEICKKAQVNRSTFYLHYETIDDLLSESADYILETFFDYYKGFEKIDPKTCDTKDLYLITPKYIKPYLSFIKEHKRLFEALAKNYHLFTFKYGYNELYKYMINPIMDRFNVKEEKRKYINSFFMHGVLAIVKEWVDGGCKDSIDFISETIDNCMFPTKL